MTDYDLTAALRALYPTCRFRLRTITETVEEYEVRTGVGTVAYVNHGDTVVTVIIEVKDDRPIAVAE